jgi:nucleotide-binding universal stress UspA family protein
MLAAGGGENAVAAAPLAYGMARKSSAPVKIVHVTERRPWWARLLHRRLSRSATGQVEQLRALSTGGRAPEIADVGGISVAGAICEEAKRGCDVIMLGSGEGPSIGGAVVEQVVAAAPCHVAIMKAPVRGAEYKRILVPVDGSVASRLAVELALRYSETAGAELALAVLTERRPQAAAYADLSGTHVPSEVRATTDEELQRISIAFRASDIKPNILHLAFDPRSSAISQEVDRGHYDLVVVGAENRAIQHRLFFGYENERLIRGTRIPVIVVVPNLSRLGANAHA